MIATISDAPARVELSNKGLISDQLWTRLTSRIVKDEGMDLALAERIMDQALGFLRLCAEKTSPEAYSPSPLVDVGWHTFILYTKPYARFCQEIAGHFIHHNPTDEEGVDYGTGNIARTVAALKQHGVVVDEPLWANTGHDCDGSCDASGTCGDGGDPC